jgi:hypothetical protein
MISIQSLEENEFVRNLTKKSIPGAFKLWIGAKRTSSGRSDFEWENGNPFLYNNWDSNEPNNFGGNENYVNMRVYNGFWSDFTDFRLAFICE